MLHVAGPDVQYACLLGMLHVVENRQVRGQVPHLCTRDVAGVNLGIKEALLPIALNGHVGNIELDVSLTILWIIYGKWTNSGH